MARFEFVLLLFALLIIAAGGAGVWFIGWPAYSKEHDARVAQDGVIASLRAANASATASASEAQNRCSDEARAGVQAGRIIERVVTAAPPATGQPRGIIGAGVIVPLTSAP